VKAKYRPPGRGFIALTDGMLITGRIPDKGHSDCIMTFLRFAPALCILMIAASRPGLAEPSLDPPNWSAAAARQAVAQSDTAAALRPLLALARTQQHDVLLKELRMLSANDDLALPARERILFEFATSLGALEPHEIDPGVLSWLMSYEPRVLVPHEDAGLSGVPMYKVRAAAAGVAYNRQRQSAGRRAAARGLQCVPPDRRGRQGHVSHRQGRDGTGCHHCARPDAG